MIKTSWNLRAPDGNHVRAESAFRTRLRDEAFSHTRACDRLPGAPVQRQVSCRTSQRKLVGGGVASPGFPSTPGDASGRPWPTCTQMLARPTLALGIPFAQLKKLSRSPENSVPSATGQTRLRREARAARGPRAPGGHRLALPARCVAQAQVCNLFPRRGRKNDYFLREDVHSISSL